VGVNKATEFIGKAGKFTLYSAISTAVLFILGIFLGVF
jgi:hypothetical protein